MNPDMLQATQATQAMDDVRIVSPQGHENARIVFKLVLFFTGGNTLDVQLNALTALADLADDVQPHLAFMQCAGDDAWPEPFDLHRFRERSEQAIRQLHAGGPYTQGIDLGLFGAEFTPPGNTGVTPFGGSVLAGGGLEVTADISFLEFSTSLMWDAEAMFRRHVERARKAASTLGAAFGVAGFGLQYDRIYGSQAGSYPYLVRFPGLHCGLDDHFMSEFSVRKQVADQYFTMNWLTLLGDDLIAGRLSAEALETQLGPDRPVSRYDGGIILQAGPYPQLGDVNQGLELSDYRAVNAAIKGMRFEGYEVPILDAPEPLDSLEATFDWIRRFD